MKKILTCLTAGLLIIGGQSVLAQSTTTNSANASAHQLTPEQRREHMKEILKLIGLTPADLKGLSKEDRQAKIKEAAENTVAELKAKQSSGTLTDEQQAKLEKVEKFLSHAGHKKAPPTDNN